MNSIFIKISSACVLVLIFMSQFVPTAYVGVKAVLLVIGGGGVSVAMIRGKLFLLKWQVLGIFFLVTCGILYSTYGFVRGNPGAIRVLSVWLLWPIVYLGFSTLLRQCNGYESLVKIFKLSLAGVVFYGFLYLGYMAGIVPDWLYIDLDQGQEIGFHDGYVEYNLYSISSLIFLFPFFSHYLLEKYKRGRGLRVDDMLLWFASIILVLLTGRRALFFIVLILPVIVFFSNKLLANDRKINIRISGLIVVSLCSAGFLYLFYRFGLRLDSVIAMFVDGFDFGSGSGSASERAWQYNALIDGWLNSSIAFGAGNGAAAAVSRSEIFPWAYELTYVYLLFSTGLVGVVVYFGWYGYGLNRLRRAIRARPDLAVYAAPILTGSLSLGIAAATNPYFGKFDYLWMLLLPFFISGWARYQRVVEFR